MVWSWGHHKERHRFSSLPGRKHYSGPNRAVFATVSISQSICRSVTRNHPPSWSSHYYAEFVTCSHPPILSLLEHNLALPINFVIGIPATLAGQFSKPKPWLLQEIPTASVPLKTYASLPQLFPSSLKLHCSAPFGGMNLERVHSGSKTRSSNMPF